MNVSLHCQGLDIYIPSPQEQQTEGSNNKPDCSRPYIEGLGIYLLLVSDPKVILGSSAPKNEDPRSCFPFFNVENIFK